MNNFVSIGINLEDGIEIHDESLGEMACLQFLLDPSCCKLKQVHSIKELFRRFNKMVQKDLPDQIVQLTDKVNMTNTFHRLLVERNWNDQDIENGSLVLIAGVWGVEYDIKFGVIEIDRRR